MLGLSRRALYRRLERLDLGDTIMRRREAPADGVGASSGDVVGRVSGLAPLR